MVSTVAASDSIARSAEHVRHQWVLNQPLLKSPAVPGMMNGLRHGLPHQR